MEILFPHTRWDSSGSKFFLLRVVTILKRDTSEENHCSVHKYFIVLDMPLQCTKKMKHTKGD